MSNSAGPEPAGDAAAQPSAVEIDRLIGQLAAAADALGGGGMADLSTAASASALLAASARLYAAVSTHAERPPPATDLVMTPTEACIAAAALLRSQSLTPFEFAIWFTGGGPSPDSGGADQ